jgi:hypothetical protein
MAHPISDAELYSIRGFSVPGYAYPDLRKIQQMNKNAADTLAAPGRLGSNWRKLANDGHKLAKEMTNRLNNPANTAKKQLYCDARKWVNAEPSASASVKRMKRPIEDNEGYYLYVEYNATGEYRGEYRKHFFNFMMVINRRPIVKGGRDLTQHNTEIVQLAHLSMFTNIDPVLAAGDRNPASYTPLGFMHLKDDLSQGALMPDPRGPVGTYPAVQNPAYPSKHRQFDKGSQFVQGTTGRYKRHTIQYKDSRLLENFRRYFIYIQTTME